MSLETAHLASLVARAAQSVESDPDNLDRARELVDAMHEMKRHLIQQFYDRMNHDTVAALQMARLQNPQPTE